MVYDLLLVRESIGFEEFYSDETPEEWMKDRIVQTLTLHVAKPNEEPLFTYMGTPLVHRIESLTPVEGRSRWDDEFQEDKTRSYRIFRGTIAHPCLRILHTNRFLYKEASSIFYGKNVFTFPSKACELTLNACSAFLTDRPKHALPCIKNINLGIARVDSLWLGNTPLFYGVHYPTVKRVCDTLRNTVHLSQLSLLVEEQHPIDGGDGEYEQR